MASDQPQHADAAVYAVVVPVWSSYHRDAQGRPLLEGAKVERMTQKRPTGRLPSGGIVTRLVLRVDAAALLPLQPEAVIHVRAGEVDLIEVEAIDPREEGLDTVGGD